MIASIHCLKIFTDCVFLAKVKACISLGNNDGREDLTGRYRLNSLFHETDCAAIISIGVVSIVAGLSDLHDSIAAPTQVRPLPDGFYLIAKVLNDFLIIPIDHNTDLSPGNGIIRTKFSVFIALHHTLTHEFSNGFFKKRSFLNI